MKLRRIFLLGSLLASSLTVLASAAPAPAKAKAPKSPGPPPLSPRFIVVRERINTLFELRNEAPPPPDPRSNPFRPLGPLVAASTTPGAAPTIAGDDLVLLQQAITTLRVSGTLEKDEQFYVMVNNRPYKKDDVIQARAEGEIVYLKVREITRQTVTLALNDTELTLKF